MSVCVKVCERGERVCVCEREEREVREGRECACEKKECV